MFFTEIIKIVTELVLLLLISLGTNGDSFSFSFVADGLQH